MAIFRVERFNFVFQGGNFGFDLRLEIFQFLELSGLGFQFVDAHGKISFSCFVDGELLAALVDDRHDNDE